MEDYYKILGLNSSATPDEIRRAYRVLARRYHPDVNPGEKSAEKFKDIAEAYKILSDEAKKRKYDSDFNASFRSGSFRDQQRRKFWSGWGRTITSGWLEPRKSFLVRTHSILTRGYRDGDSSLYISLLREEDKKRFGIDSGSRLTWFP